MSQKIVKTYSGDLGKAVLVGLFIGVVIGAVLALNCVCP